MFTLLNIMGEISMKRIIWHCVTIAILILLQVMERTNTIVTWPSRLKIGAKSKKGKQPT